MLYDKAHEYKVRHADAWKAEEDSNKRVIRLNNLVELFKICELLKNVVSDQITSTTVDLSRSLDETSEESKDSANPNASPNKKKKKKPKKERPDELEPLRQESLRLQQLPNSSKPYHYKCESQNGDSKIVKFSKVPKNQCLYCA